MIKTQDSKPQFHYDQKRLEKVQKLFFWLKRDLNQGLREFPQEDALDH